MKKILIISVFLVLIGGYFLFKKEVPVSSFEECVEAGYPVMESYPRRCLDFVEEIGNELEKRDLIILNSPRPNQVIESPLLIEGEARGFWFFEADFPIVIIDGKGEVIGEGIAFAKSEWMTENFVPFQSEIEFKRPETEKGTLILFKDNPSGLPEHDDQLIIPVRF